MRRAGSIACGLLQRRRSCPQSWIALMLLLAPVAVVTNANAAAPSALSARQQTLVNEIPTSSAAQSRKIFDELDKGSAQLVEYYVPKLSMQQSEDDVKARFVISGLVWNVGAYGSASEKKSLAEALFAGISDVSDPVLKDFLIEQMQFLDLNPVSAKLFPLLKDETLGQRTLRTLMAASPKGLADAVIQSLDGTTSSIQEGLLLAIARLKPEGAAAKVAPFAENPDPRIKLAAQEALVGIGDPASKELLKKATDGNSGFYDDLAPARYLEYAQNLNRRGKKDAATAVCRDLLSGEDTSATSHIKSGALTVLAEVEHEKALPELYKVLASDNDDLRATALRAINNFKSPAVTQALVEKLKTAPAPEVAVDIIDWLGDRRDKTALPAIEALAKSGDKETRVQAINAAGEIDRKGALPAYLDILKTESDKDINTAIADQLSRLAGVDTNAAVAKAVVGAGAAGRVVMIGYLGERDAVDQKKVIFAATKDPEQTVRAAAYKAIEAVAEPSDLSGLLDVMLATDKTSEQNSARKAYVAAAKRLPDGQNRASLLMSRYEVASPAQKALILDTLSGVADSAALPLVMKEASTSSTPEVQDAAVRALSDWQSLDVHDDLVTLAKSSTNEKHQVIAARGLIRLAADETDKHKHFEKLKEAMKFSHQPDEQKAVLAALGDIRTSESLRLVGEYVENPNVKAEAVDAALKIALPAKKYKGIRTAESAEILKRGLDGLDPAKRKEVEKFINEILGHIALKPLPEDSEGFASLFNGRNLKGWVGDLDGYEVRNGNLVCKKKSGGKLFTEKEFSDFVMRFDYKLEAGTNNGVGIRTPLNGDPAYVGMEIQLLDNNDPQYKDIFPWQRNGSVYGIAAAGQTDFKPYGEWNSEEITAIGRHIKVVVNGKVVNDVDLDEATSQGIVSGKLHPGVKNNSGHIGFLGHGYRIDFKNIRVKKIGNDTPPAGFTSLFNGKNLDGWKGLVANPIKRAKMTPEELATAQGKADESMNEHWKAVNNVLVFDGNGSHLCTNKQYKNFEMYVDWRIGPGGDSGIYLRGSPQVQIWDPHYWPQGSGGLYNNEKSTSNPLVVADNPIGQWNRFHIKMVGDKVTVHFNDKLVVDNEVLENYWDRNQPIFPIDQIELQSHGSPAWFRNIYIKELP